MGKHKGNEHTARRRNERKKQKERKRAQQGHEAHAVAGRKLTRIVTVTEHFESEAS